MLKVFFRILLIAPLFFSPKTFAQDLVMPGTAEQQQAFLSGVAMAIGFMNDGNKVFCPPIDMELSGDLVREYADRGLTGLHEPITVAMAAVLELKIAWPCIR